VAGPSRIQIEQQRKKNLRSYGRKGLSDDSNCCDGEIIRLKPTDDTDLHSTLCIYFCGWGMWNWARFAY
jgi:hypothetical protein